MIKIYIIADSFKQFEQPIKEYTKRLWKKLEIIKIKPSKNWTQKQIIQKEAQNIAKYIKPENFNILLSLQWKSISSEAFATKIISKSYHQWQTLCFFIWWAFGLDEALLKNINYKLKLSEFTLPHSLALTVIIEQIYRSFQILSNKSYHY